MVSYFGFPDRNYSDEGIGTVHCHCNSSFHQNFASASLFRLNSIAVGSNLAVTVTQTQKLAENLIEYENLSRIAAADS